VKVPGGVKLTRSLKPKFEDPGVDCVFLIIKDELCILNLRAILFYPIEL
jgi:hypothetical protein